ncbi:hypothetical protein AB833_23155 [Chromatiales bacterium (ex Bugula neritina AB1)]|nr:hypothetical protein AB833_23155 [Chromatiales bacterium (ex Bugula neritina AB1)]
MVSADEKNDGIYNGAIAKERLVSHLQLTAFSTEQSRNVCRPTRRQMAIIPNSLQRGVKFRALSGSRHTGLMGRLD